MMNLRVTKHCVSCGGDAVVWRGHVHTQYGILMAGHCEKHKVDVEIENCPNKNDVNCYGERELLKSDIKFI